MVAKHKRTKTKRVVAKSSKSIVSDLRRDYNCEMLKQVRIYRHGQAEHNLEDPKGKILPSGKRECRTYLKDPLLTDSGKTDAKNIDLSWCKDEKSRIAFVSPLRRTLQTATIAIKANKAKMKCYALEELREINNNQLCNHRDSIKDAKKDFVTVDFSSIVDSKAPRDGAEKRKDFRDACLVLRKRSLRLLRFLEKCKQKHIALFSHGRFMACLTSEIMGIGRDYTINPAANGAYVSLMFCRDIKTGKKYWMIDTKHMQEDTSGASQLTVSKILPAYDP